MARRFDGKSNGTRYPSKSAAYPVTHAGVDLASLADGLTALVAGGYVAAKALGDQKALVAQCEMNRRHPELLFSPC